MILDEKYKCKVVANRRKDARHKWSMNSTSFQMKWVETVYLLFFMTECCQYPNYWQFDIQRYPTVMGWILNIHLALSYMSNGNFSINGYWEFLTVFHFSLRSQGIKTRCFNKWYNFGQLNWLLTLTSSIIAWFPRVRSPKWKG